MDKDSAGKIEKRRRDGKARKTVPLFFLLAAASALLVPGLSGPALQAGGDLRPRGPRVVAMAGSGTALPGSQDLNPALLVDASRAAALSWTPSRFGLSELADASAAWVQPFNNVLTARLSLQHTGFEAYRELRAEVAAGLHAAPRLRVGCAAALQHVSMARHGTAVAWGVDIAALLELAEDLRCAAVAENALQLPFAADERLPVRLRIGLGWETGALRIAVDVEKESRFALATRLGVEYAFEDCLFLRMGVGGAPSEGTAGFALRTRGLEIGYAVAVHPDLGWTHTAGIGFQP
ncbi:MAG: hypothetical protein RRA94_06885 [Bacteroidota bacterium]|nr:hypothetical protein [Bacteroidota bacterium]